MQMFCVKPAVHCFDRFHDFAEAFSLGPEDLLFTERFLYDQYARPEGLSCHVLFKDQYDPGEPKEEVVDAILRDMAPMTVRRVIAMGGGSVIDIAKLLCVRNAYPCRRIILQEEVPEIDKELIVLPTTCGTGSEVTYGGIFTMADTGFKTGVLSPVLSAAHAVLVPELILSLPWRTKIHCSVDALGHAMESYVSTTRGNEMVRAVGGRAIALLLEGYAVLAREGDTAWPDLTKRFLTASCLAGMAVNNGGAGPVHALAYPLGETYKVPHGESIYQFLTPVFRWYERTADGPLLEELRKLIRPALQAAGYDAAVPFEDLERLLNSLCPPCRLSEYGMEEADIDPFVENIFLAKGRLLAASFTPLTAGDAAALYRLRL